MFVTIFLLTLALVGIAFLGFSLKLLLHKDGKFPETRVGHNKEMRKRKIYCVKTQQKIIDKQIIRENKLRNDTPLCDGCV